MATYLSPAGKARKLPNLTNLLTGREIRYDNARRLEVIIASTILFKICPIAAAIWAPTQARQKPDVIMGLFFTFD
jgi:hypothetical protein